ncbi:GyrI-like domain-containing protein [Terribacillus saccharophilus]|uniref:AraC family transcriptional regulator n=1 Tax=Terribacillus saccharophilus TaxID=361277 RepID=UPI00398281BB
MKMEKLPYSRIAYFRNTGEYGDKQNRELMESFKKWLQYYDNFADRSPILGIPQDNPAVTPKEACRYDVCVLINEDFMVAEPAQVGYFAGGRYAVFVLDHTKEAIEDFWGDVFSVMETHNLPMRNTPIIERYTSEMIENHLCEILIPIQ